MKQWILLLFTAVFLMACDDEIKTEKDMNRYVNRWIHDNMSAVYYWTEDLPVYRRSYNSPSDYFYTLLSQNDRYSGIHPSYQELLNQLNGVRYTDVGFDFQLYRESRNNNNVFGVVLYLKAGTPAESLGISRGNIFTKINGNQLSTNNYSNLISSFYNINPDVTVTFAADSNGVLVDDKTLNILKATNYSEDPVYLDTIYSIQQRKIGYLVYHFFAGDPGDDSKVYDLKLNNLIAGFNQGNITDLIVDFRYNSGGAMSSAINFASMLVPGLAADKVFAHTEYNRNYTRYFNSDEFKKKYDFNPFTSNFTTKIDVKTSTTQTYPIQNVGSRLQQIYFLTGKSTASASEMVINGLKPFISCVLIGDTTVGKNVGSTLINDEENEQNNWAIMPIILKYFNKDRQSEFTDGFAPDHRIPENYAYPLGDTRDPLLSKAIELIAGIQPATQGAGKMPVKKVTVSGISIENQPRGLIIDSDKFP
jgi:carboxyl-terminal processing protease